MRSALLIAATAVIAVWSAPQALTQDAATPCDLRTLVKAKWCSRCNQLATPAGISKTGKHLATVTTSKPVLEEVCGGAVVDVELCAKKHYVCKPCGAQRDGPGKCACGKTFSEETDQAPVLHECEVCLARARVPDLVKHDEAAHKDKKDRTCRKVCARSGKAPHIGKK